MVVLNKLLGRATSEPEGLDVMINRGEHVSFTSHHVWRVLLKYDVFQVPVNFLAKRIRYL